MALSASYQGKWVLITGASMGIGEVFARKFARQKANLILTARSIDRLQALSDVLSRSENIETSVISCDLAAPSGPSELCAEIKKRGIQVFGLVNNAGCGGGGLFAKAPLERYLHMIDLNVRALVELTHRLIGEMIERKEGFVINVSSTASYQPIPYSSIYAATKAFVTSFTEALWLETRNTGVRVLNLCPGLTKTNFGLNAGLKDFHSDPLADDAQDVVDAALGGLRKNKPTVISGLKNKILAKIERLLPHRAVLEASLIFQDLRGRSR